MGLRASDGTLLPRSFRFPRNVLPRHSEVRHKCRAHHVTEGRTRSGAKHRISTVDRHRLPSRLHSADAPCSGGPPRLSPACLPSPFPAPKSQPHLPAAAQHTVLTIQRIPVSKCVPSLLTQDYLDQSVNHSSWAAGGPSGISLTEGPHPSHASISALLYACTVWRTLRVIRCIPVVSPYPVQGPERQSKHTEV